MENDFRRWITLIKDRLLTEMRVIAYHGTDATDIKSFDLGKTGQGATAGHWAPGYQPEASVYFATERHHAANYGKRVYKFLIDAPLLEKDAAQALESWAKELHCANHD
jgi:hypothetical protein